MPGATQLHQRIGVIAIVFLDNFSVPRGRDTPEKQQLSLDLKCEMLFSFNSEIIFYGRYKGMNAHKVGRFIREVRERKRMREKGRKKKEMRKERERKRERVRTCCSVSFVQLCASSKAQTAILSPTTKSLASKFQCWKCSLRERYNVASYGAASHLRTSTFAG